MFIRKTSSNIIPFNIRDLVEVFKHPIPTVLRLSLGPTALAAYQVYRALGVPQNKIYICMKELAEDTTFWRHIKEKLFEAKKKEPRTAGWIDLRLLPYIYALVRLFKPEVVVETGVGPGGSSAFMLNALEKNQFGVLYSIDLPGHDAVVYPRIGKHYDLHIPPGFNTGWLVPSRFKSRWNLILGDAKEELPSLLRKLKVIDMFLHDSLHTYEHMMFEYILALRHLSQGGLLLSDDVNKYWSLAFIDLCKSTKIPHCVLFNRLGIAKKIQVSTLT